MAFRFDEEISRKGTHSVKWEFISDGVQLTQHDLIYGRPEEERLVPIWVADMDFRSPPAVVEALVERAEHGIYGYTSPTDSYYEAVIGWIARRYGWTIEREWITLTPGVVPALNMLVQTIVAPGEKVLIQPPVYHPFFMAIENNGRQVAANALRYEDDGYCMDFDDLAQQAADPAVKMALLCSPHNPVGRVWTPAELARFGEICLENDVLVVSDEIHCDLIYSDHTFTSFATVDDAFARNSVICTAASKTFNLAGLKTSNIIIRDEALRDRFAATCTRNGLVGTNAFGVVATEAAYNHGEAWLEAAMAYIEENYRFMATYLAQHLPQLKIVPP